MWMKIKTWLYRRGFGRWIFYSPSAAMVWEKGTLFKPGKHIVSWAEWSKSLTQQVLSKQTPDFKKEN